MTANYPDGDPTFDWMQPLTVDAGLFGEWLRAKEPDAICGEAKDPLHCPLASYLSFAYRMPIDVTGDGVRFAWEHTPFHPLPLWGRYFIELIDDRGGPIMAGDALVLLGRALRAGEDWRSDV